MSAAPAPSRPISPPPPSASKRPSAPPPKTAPRRESTPPRPARRPRRRGRFKRFVQVSFSVLVMIVVPLAALVAAYGYGNGKSLPVDVGNLVTDIRELLGI